MKDECKSRKTEAKKKSKDGKKITEGTIEKGKQRLSGCEMSTIICISHIYIFLKDSFNQEQCREQKRRWNENKRE